MRRKREKLRIQKPPRLRKKYAKEKRKASQGILGRDTTRSLYPLFVSFKSTKKRSTKKGYKALLVFEGRILCEGKEKSLLKSKILKASGPSKTNSFQIEDKYQE